MAPARGDADFSSAFADAAEALGQAPAFGNREHGAVSPLRGQLAAAQWRQEDAVDHFAMALRLDPASHWVNDNAARANLLLLDLEAAEAQLALSVSNDAAHRLRQGGAWKATQTIVGQILDEYKLDRRALDRLREAQSAKDPSEAVAKVVSNFLTTRRPRPAFCSPCVASNASVCSTLAREAASARSPHKSPNSGTRKCHRTWRRFAAPGAK